MSEIIQQIARREQTHRPQTCLTEPMLSYILKIVTTGAVRGSNACRSKGDASMNTDSPIPQKAGWKIVIERKNMSYELELSHGTYILATADAR